MRQPPRTIAPRSGVCAPAMMLKSVVLPAPFGAIRAVIVLGWISKETSASACSPRNDLLICCTARLALIGTASACVRAQARCLLAENRQLRKAQYRKPAV